MNLTRHITDATGTDVRQAVNRAHADKLSKMRTHLDEHGWVRTGGIWGGFLTVPKTAKLGRDFHLDWPERLMRLADGRIFMPPVANLVVDSGVHILAQRGFVTTAGAALTPVAGTTNDGVRYGGVDNNVTAVAASTSQFDTTASNRFVTLFDSDPTYDDTLKRATTQFTVTDADFTNDHERVGQGNDAANGAGSLFSMISNYTFSPGASLTYSLLYENQTNFTGS